MKIKKQVIKDFEADQKQYGTEVAIYNLVFMIMTKVLIEYGNKSIKVVADK